jgi:hypothetical protein
MQETPRPDDNTAGPGQPPIEEDKTLEAQEENDLDPEEATEDEIDDEEGKDEEE